MQNRTENNLPMLKGRRLLSFLLNIHNYLHMKTDGPALSQIVSPAIDYNSDLSNVDTIAINSVNQPPYTQNPPIFHPKNGSSSVISTDVILDPIKKTWVRLYRPGNIINSTEKLPLIVYYHGGGFVSDGADSVTYDVFCRGLVEAAGAMVISLNYRKAPGHRLPAAYEDAMDALYWIKNMKDEWVVDYADLEDCYLCGSSSGGNLAYHAGLRYAAVSKDLEPLRIKGLVLHHPYFSGKKRTSSEQRLENDSALPLSRIHRGFELSLPEGSNRDHEYCNPFMNGGSKGINMMKELGCRVLVAGCYDDPLIDKVMECGNVLEDKGLCVVRFYVDGYHNMEVVDPAMSRPLYDVIKDFVFKNEK